jgi:putative transposase
MKRTRFTEEQIIAVLHEASGPMSIREVSRNHGITEQTFFRWRAKYGGLQLSEAKKLKALEDENRRLKRLVADLSLDNSMLKDVVGRKW